MSRAHPVERLAVYGSLVPGGVNHHVLAGVEGTWRRGWVTGVLHPEGWGAAKGYPGIRLEDGGERIEVHVLESAGLDAYWDRLDAFEGAEYRRRVVDVHGLEDRPVPAFIYELRPAPGGGR